MAKYYVEFSCGHTDEVQLFGKMSERERKIGWLEREGLCPACWEAQKAEQRQREVEAAEKAAKEKGLPELTGTPKQVAWAVTIRAKMMQSIDEYEERNRGRKNHPKYPMIIKAIEEARAYLASKTDAAFFIENRMKSGMDLINKSLTGKPVTF